MTEAKRTMPIKGPVLKFDDIGYPGFWCRRRLNLSLGFYRRLFESVREGEEETSRSQWLEVFPEWNFVDTKGEPIPHTEEGFDAIPKDLWDAMVERGSAAAKEAAMPVNLDGSSSNGVEEPATA